MRRGTWKARTGWPVLSIREELNLTMSIGVNQSGAPVSLVTGQQSLLTRSVVLVLLLTFTSTTLSTQVRAQPSDEYEVKAAFLYNFVKFVEWPPEAFHDRDAPIIIGVVGDDPFGSKIDQVINGKFANGRRMILKRFHNMKALTYCHMIFICSSERNNLRQILTATGAGVLTVGESDQFTQSGGIINFTIVESKVRFEINQRAAERAGLKISAKLLILGRPARS